MIAFDYPCFVELFARYPCGRCVSSLDQVANEVPVILEGHDSYRQAAFQAYEEVYEFSRHFASVLDWVDSL
jgi:hypothetical protein